jgi:FkbM family methyltransferase
VWNTADLVKDFYATFVEAGSLAFDAGAHHGSRTAAFRELGARVVAIEPVRESRRVLFARFHQDPDVTIVPQALGATEGRCEIMVSSPKRFSSSISPHYVRAALESGRYQPRVTSWDESETVDVTTLDTLVLRFGVPAFIKIDVEGAEDQVLRGLSRAVAALSFEFHPHFLEPARRSMAWLQQLGEWQMNFVVQEHFRWELDAWVDPARMAATLDRLEAGVPFLYGDVYARLVTPV